MKRILVVLLAAFTFFPVIPAHAYEDGDDRGNGYRSGEDCRDGGGCHNRRYEDYDGAGCKYICPSFDKSPVHDAFNFSPFVCMPGATCYEDGDKRKNQEGSNGNS